MESRYQLNRSVLSAESEDELVLMDTESGIYYGMNEVGRGIWKLLEEEKSVSEIEHRIAREYDVEMERVEADLRQFLASLERKHLIIPLNSTSATNGGS